MSINKFNIGDDAYIFADMHIMKFKINHIAVCKQRNIIEYGGYLYSRCLDGNGWYLTDDEPVHTPEACCFSSIDEVIAYTNLYHPFFHISLKDGEATKSLLP